MKLESNVILYQVIWLRVISSISEEVLLIQDENASKSSFMLRKLF